MTARTGEDENPKATTTAIASEAAARRTSKRMMTPRGKPARLKAQSTLAGRSMADNLARGTASGKDVYDRLAGLSLPRPVLRERGRGKGSSRRRRPRPHPTLSRRTGRGLCFASPNQSRDLPATQTRKE